MHFMRRPLFGRKLDELGLTNEFAYMVLEKLGETFTLDELRRSS